MTKSAGSPSAAEAAKEFIARRISAGKKEYGAFELLEKTAWTEADREKGRYWLAKAADIHIREELNAAERFYGTVETLIVHPFTPGVLLIRFWSECLEAAHPHRPSMQSVVNDFPSLLNHVSPILPAYLEFIPQVIRHIKRDGIKVMPRLSEITTGLIANDEIENYFKFLGLYLPFVSGPMFRGVMEAGSVIFKGRRDLETSFKSICPPDENLVEEPDREKFLEKLGSLFSTPGLPVDHMLEPVLLMGADTLTGAAHAMGRLAKLLPGLSEQHANSWLAAFADIIRFVGVAAVSFCITTLPKRIAALSAEDLEKHIHILRTVSESYGREAAFAYLSVI